jgi:signal transduction histidine kinase
VADQGRGFDPAAKNRGGGDSGFGLFSIRERLPHLGGDFELESTPGGGTRVTVRVPRGGLPRDAQRERFE